MLVLYNQFSLWRSLYFIENLLSNVAVVLNLNYLRWRVVREIRTLGPGKAGKRPLGLDGARVYPGKEGPF